MEKVRPWCCQPSDRGRLRNRNRNRLTWVVTEKGPLNGCVCVCVNVVSKTEFYAALNTIKSKVQYTKYESKVGN